MKKVLLGFFILILISSAYGLSCQYTETEEYNETNQVFFHNGQEIGKNLDMNTSVTVEMGSNAIKITNQLSVPITLDISYVKKSSWFGYNDKLNEIVTVNSNDYDAIVVLPDSCRNYPCGIEQIKYEFISPNIIHSESITENKTREVCQQCLPNSGQDCLNDGAYCSNSNRCGGGYCIENKCSTSLVCLDNNCQCSDDKIQCSDNTQCVKKKSVESGSEPICSSQECETSYVDEDTGLCKKSPGQIGEFILYVSISLAIIIVFGVIGKWYLKNKHEHEKQATLTAAKSLEAAKIRRKKYELNQLQQDIEKIEKQKNRTKGKIDEIEKLKEDLEKKKTDLKKMSKDFYFKKYKERYGNKIYLDEKTEYIRFKRNNEYLHQYIYRTEYGPYNKRNEIHHIDANHYNNEIWNLIELSQAQHYKIKHGKINYGGWASGIIELKRSGISIKDFPEKVIEHFKE
jgi:hypothetical protein